MLAGHGVLSGPLATARKPFALMGGGGIGTDDLLSWWVLDEATGTRIDVHGGLDATAGSGAGPGSRAGLVGSAVDIAGNWLKVPAGLETTISSATPVTVCTWVYLDTLTVGFPIARWDGTGNWGTIVDGAGAASFFVARGAGSESATTPNGTITTGAWHLVIGWIDPAASANGTIYVQVNNGTIYSFALTGAVTNSGISLRTFFGCINDGSFGLMDGAVDETSFWNKILTADERSFIFNGGAGVTYTDL